MSGKEIYKDEVGNFRARELKVRGTGKTVVAGGFDGRQPYSITIIKEADLTDLVERMLDLYLSENYEDRARCLKHMIHERAPEFDKYDPSIFTK